MIRPLRQLHRRMAISLGVFLPMAFAAGIVARKPAPVMEALPDKLAATSPSFPAELWERTDLFPKSPIKVRLLREAAHAGGYAVAFSAAKDFLKPDLVVYWITGNPSPGGALPDNAILLGEFASSALPLPAEAVTNRGVLVLYSLANNALVDTSTPANFVAPSQ